MNERVPRHPGAETMAALLDGRLATRELAETTEHLRDCADCRTTLGEMARFEREEGLAAAPATSTSQWRLRLIAAAVAAAALLVPVTRYVQQRLSPVATLIAAAPREHRRTVARISGAPWAPPPSHDRGGPVLSPEELQFRGAAGAVIEETQDLDTVTARHAAGVAHLLIDQIPQSVDRLDRAARRSDDARVWNDLAAARYAVGEERSYPDALAAADRAIALDPRMAEAHFNRALILEAMGRAEAVAAWQRYLELDPSSEWATEAREHLTKLTKPRADFLRELDLARRDASRIAALVHAFPQPSRRYTEAVLLGEWADAEASGDSAAAAKLALVRAIGQQLAATNGDSLLRDTVAAIDRTQGPARIAIAEAHRLHRDGRREESLPLLERATIALRAAGSPMADSAAQYAAAELQDQNRGDEAVPRLRALLARVDARRHPSLAAEIRWTLANCANVAADWATAVREASLASAEFERLGESEHAAFAAGVAAYALDGMGRTDQAWQQYVRAFAGTRDNSRKHAALLHAAGLGLAATEQHAAAEALAALIAGDPNGRPVTVADTLTRLARSSMEHGAENVERPLRDARAIAQRIESAQAGALATAQIDVADGMQRLRSDPRAAAALIGRAIDFFHGVERKIDLADAHLQRGRAWRAAGDDAAALHDFDAAMQNIEQQQLGLGAQKDLEFLDKAARIIDETIELQLDRGDGRAAFEIADRAHALLDKTATAPIPAGTALLEYVLLPRRVAIFCLTHDGLTAVTVAIPRRDIERDVERFAAAIRARAGEPELQALAQSLHRALVAPVGSELAGIDELVIVPDRELHALSFASLFDGERYLLERYTIRYAPSAAETPRPPRAELTPAVTFADPKSERWNPLPYSRAEAEEVGAVLDAETIAGADATRTRFLEALQRNAVVHYAGHADSEAGANGALVLAPSANDPGLLSARDIARLSLRERSPLVVLSACGTLRGDLRHIAGSPTVGRAFLTAGARAVVGTQWEVKDDLTRALFVRFHQELRAGQAPARALRTAQIAMLQSSDPRRRHPAAWSAAAVLSNL